MKTRKELVEFLRKNHVDPNESDWLANKLISEGFVQVEEPREFWIVKRKLWNDYKVIEKYDSNFDEIIHVREIE